MAAKKKEKAKAKKVPAAPAAPAVAAAVKAPVAKKAAPPAKKPAAVKKPAPIDPEPDPKPDYDSMRKADLVELCQEREIGAGGTAEELRERLREDDAGADNYDDDDDGQSSEDSLHLGGMRKAGLTKLCEQYGLSLGGTADDLRERIQKALDGETATSSKPEPKTGRKRARDGDDDDEDPEEWEAVILSRVKGLDARKIHPSWSDPKSILTPGLWPLLLDREPLEESNIYNRFNQPGDELRGMMGVWRSSWRLGEAELQGLAHGFQGLYSALRSRPSDQSPRAWSLRNWDRHVTPLIVLSLRKQAALVGGAASRRLQAMAETPWHVLSYDAGAAVHANTNTKSQAIIDVVDVDDDETAPLKGRRGRNAGRNGRRRRGDGNVKCRKCGKSFPLGALSVKEFFDTHNKTCK